ncbi:MAG: hypothetical protein ISS47_10150 [Candidatus Omnitrophica bacterium]|nr:hypothetical protein [Candidatus Omnitrophota bacterium]
MDILVLNTNKRLRRIFFYFFTPLEKVHPVRERSSLTGFTIEPQEASFNFI